MKLMPIEDLKRLPVKAGAFFMLCPFMCCSIIRKLTLPATSIATIKYLHLRQ